MKFYQADNANKKTQYSLFLFELRLFNTIIYWNNSEKRKVINELRSIIQPLTFG